MTDGQRNILYIISKINLVGQKIINDFDLGDLDSFTLNLAGPHNKKV